MARRKKKAEPILEGLEFLSQPSYVKRYGFIAKSTTKNYTMVYTMSKGFGSYTGWNRELKKYFMNVDPWQYQNDKLYGLSEYSTIIKGLTYHESGHVLFTDFNIIKRNAEILEEKNKQVAKIADDLMSDSPTKTHDDLVQAIYEFYYQLFLIDMLNSMEDASIEASMSASVPASYANICYLRNQVYDKEIKSIRNNYDSSILRHIVKGHEKITKDFISSIITEIRHMAVIGYRQPLKYWILPEYYDDDVITDMEKVAIWCRFSAITTEERNIGSKTLLDMLKKDILLPFAQQMTDDYRSALDELKDKLNEENEETQKSSSSDKSMASGSGAGSSMGGSGKSDGDLPIPKSLEEEIATKIKEELDKAKSHEKGEGTDGDGEAQDSSDAKESEASSSGGKDEEKDSSQDEKEDSYTDYSKEQRTGHIPDYEKSQEQLSKEAEKAMKDALSSAKKSFDKVSEQIDKGKIEEGKVISENAAMHDGVKTRFGPIEQFGDTITEEGEDIQKKVPELLAYANPLSKNMKKLLMYKSRNRSLIGQHKGKLNMKGLYRAKTDGRIFRKDTEGEKRNVKFAILVDESGSMSGSKIRYAMEGCYVVAKAAQRIKVPYSIFGHTEDFYDSTFEMRQYVDYKNCFKKRAIENIFKMEARENNRDGLAIYKALCSLVQNKENPDEIQFLIVISDGQPYASGYGGRSAINEMQAIMNKFKKLYGIQTIGIAIGSGCEEVARIYENSIVVPNVSELPNAMMNLLRELVI